MREGVNVAELLMAMPMNNGRSELGLVINEEYFGFKIKAPFPLILSTVFADSYELECKILNSNKKIHIRNYTRTYWSRHCLCSQSNFGLCY